jgi:hypothetical protein
MNMDRVLTVNEYYDGPRLGIAEFHGVPQIYEAEYDHSAEEYGDTYFLSPVDSELLALILEDWQIWLRWDAAFKSGEVQINTHPARPSEEHRHKVIRESIGDRLKTNPKNRTYYKAIFSFNAGETFVQWVTP